MSRLPHRPGHTAWIVGPGRVFVVYLARLVEVRGVEAGFRPVSTAGPYSDSDAAVDGAGKDEATVVVRVLSNKVHAARGAGYKTGFLAEYLFVRPRRSLFCLSQGRLLLVTVGMVLHPGPGVGDHGLSPGFSGFQPRSAWIFSPEATSVGGSPARRGASTASMLCPVMRRAASTTSLTEKPASLPRL